MSLGEMQCGAARTAPGTAVRRQNKKQKGKEKGKVRAIPTSAQPDLN
jgi:hypothetical protein